MGPSAWLPALALPVPSQQHWWPHRPKRVPSPFAGEVTTLPQATTRTEATSSPLVGLTSSLKLLKKKICIYFMVHLLAIF